MILSAPDVASAAKWSAIWEFCEYASEGLVLLGCAGEYIAEYTKWRTEDARHSLGRRSLIILILGLGTGLFSLIKTNALAGLIIVSLGEQVEHAGEKAERVAGSLELALSKSSQALSTSSDAVSNSTKAQKSASDALDTARGARKEADTFKKEIALARKEASDALANLADAKRLAEEAQRGTAILTQAAMPRRLSEERKIELVRLLSMRPAFTVVFEATRSGSKEVLDLTDDLMDVFRRMKLIPLDSSASKLPRALGSVEGRGVIIGVMGAGQTEHPPAADVLILALRSWGFEASGEAAPIIAKSATEMHILVGAKQ